MVNDYLTIHEAHELLVKKKISSVELTQQLLKRIEALEPKVKSFVTVTPEAALERAKPPTRASPPGTPPRLPAFRWR